MTPRRPRSPLELIELPIEGGQEAVGACTLCGATFRRDVIGRHLEACVKRASDGASLDALHVEARSIGLCVYWMHLLVRPDATLEDLDAALRQAWLEESCGHLSGFDVGPLQYVSRGYAWDAALPDPTVQPMKGVQVGRILHPKTSMEYEYDFGTSTGIQLRVIRKAPALAGAAVRILAQNGAPTFPCECAKNATWICSLCVLNEGVDDALLCNTCAPKHTCKECECGTEALLPLVNSPRTGICGYTGSLPLRRVKARPR